MVTSSDDGTVRLWEAIAEGDVTPESQFAQVAPREEWHQDKAEEAKAIRDWFALAFHLKQRLTFRPWDTDLRVQRAYALLQLHRGPEALAEHLQTVMQQPRAWLWPLDRNARRRAEAAAKEQRWTDAAIELSLVVRQPRARFGDWNSLLLCYLTEGKIQDYQRTCRVMLDIFEDRSDFGIRFQIIQDCCLGIVDQKLGERLVDIARKLVKTKRNAQSLQTLGLALYRAGRYREAMASFQASIQARGGNGFADTILFMAMAMHKLGIRERPHRMLSSIDRWHQKNREKEARWQSRLQWDLWLQEAKQVLAKPIPMPKAQP